MHRLENLPRPRMSSRSPRDASTSGGDRLPMALSDKVHSDNNGSEKHSCFLRALLRALKTSLATCMASMIDKHAQAYTLLHGVCWRTT